MEIIPVDEHHEAYLCIEEAFRRGVYKKPVTLIHVDSHPDLSGNRTTMSCYHRNYRAYVEKHLNIGSYISPLILRNRINRVIFVNNSEKPARTRVVGSLFGEGKNIDVDVHCDALEFFPDHRNWTYKETWNIAKLHSYVDIDNCILDIDCDYFSCYNTPRRSIPEFYNRKYQQISSDNYRVKLDFSPRWGSMSSEPAIFNNSAKWVDLLVRYFTHYLNVSPKLAIICRSAKSGYTPKRFADRIVNGLMKGLRSKPQKISIPRNEMLKFSKYFIFGRSHRYNTLTGQIYGRMEKEQEIIIKYIANGMTLGEIYDKQRLVYESSESEIVYSLLWFIFNLKKLFILS